MSNPLRSRAMLASALVLASADALGALPTTEPEQPTDEELGREFAEQQERERKRQEDFERLMLRTQAYKAMHIPPAWARSRVRGEPRRRSKRAQRAKARGW